ncbi:MAG: right-handed parallel beta-helix repeat-containing protein [Clostridiales bacterium]|nr:right-handed parallel beta-helix repeat-containing protein [Clostridiales bacterium]
MKKKVISVILAFAFCVSLSAPAFTGGPEQPSVWAVEKVNAAINVKIVPSSLQSEYKQAITRAEFCALAVALYETVTGSSIAKRQTFTDTNDINVEKAAAIGVVNGLGNSRFDPNAGLTREQAATMLSRLAYAAGKTLPEQGATFADNGSVSSWAFKSVGQMQGSGIMEGTGNNSFSPKGPYTREQSIVSIMRLYDYVKTAAIPVTEVRVSTAEEFINALSSNTKILLNPGIYNFSSLAGADKNKQIYWGKVFDGYELFLDGIHNLTIEGAGKDPSTLIVSPRYAFVMKFINSTDINIINIKAGHTEEGYCEGGVFAFYSCSDIKIDNTHMYGCGTEGLQLYGVRNMTVTNSEIYECTYYIMTVEDCENIFFDNCLFRDNEMFDLVNIYNTSNLSINKSEFRNNNSKTPFGSRYAMFSVSSSENISVTNTKFINNTAFVLNDADDIKFENNTFVNNDFTNMHYPQQTYPQADILSNDELSAYGIRLYMTIEDVVLLNGNPLSKHIGQFKKHYPFFGSQQDIYDYGNYSVIFNEGTVIAISIKDKGFTTSRGVKIGDNNDTVMQKYGYTELNEFWRYLSYAVPYKDEAFITSCISFTLDDENKVVEIMIVETGY